MSDPNGLLRDACRNNDTAQIKAIVQIHHAHIVVGALLSVFNADNKKRKQNPQDPDTDLMCESAIELVLREYQPFADAAKIDPIFRQLCDYSEPMHHIMQVFLELYVSELTAEVIEEGLKMDHSNDSHTETQAIIIITASMNKLSYLSYWFGFVACCYGQKLNLLGQMISQYHYAIPEPSSDGKMLLQDEERLLQDGLMVCCVCADVDVIRLIFKEYGASVCRYVLEACAEADDLDIVRMVFDEYPELLTPYALLFGFSSACCSQDLEMMSMYIDIQYKFDQPQYYDNIDLSRNVIFEQILNQAVFFDYPEVVEMLLTNFSHILRFEAGFAFSDSKFESSDETAKLLSSAYGSRFKVKDDGWEITKEDAMNEP